MGKVVKILGWMEEELLSLPNTSSVCPVCNGMEMITDPCPDCGGTLQDVGKESDDWGPYSPYQPIDDLKRINGWNDLSFKKCIHRARCLICGEETVVIIDEQYR